MKILIRKAKIKDASKIKALIEPYAKKGAMLSRPIYEIYESIRDFSVAVSNGKIIGCCALHIFGKEYKPYDFDDKKELILAEIRSLIVVPDWQGKNVGTQLLKKCVEEGKKLGVTKIFILTTENIISFLKRFGFKRINKARLPQKIWQECIRCSKFPSECNEIALFLNSK